ncbi:hypothetical protein Ade02nite_56410 [Paractinoplanes deccanensis]|uniref:Lipoprotein n=1 Tax=Paractinoplanes deccanensis TaxID=113561 RepID=A0ABQ3YAF8_9ACTN|nr:hypothetical protein [Actinoplanes deccanensis]GID77000.1 hypothetical protein Ade02nite_56410 [Actinoplanes deccanensis]
MGGTTVAKRALARRYGRGQRWGTAVLVGLLSLSAGCFGGPGSGSGSSSPRVPADLSAPDVAGSWREARGGAVLTFTADGRFAASNVPYEEIPHYEEDLPPGFDVTRDRLPASGDWHLTTGLGPPDGPRSTVLLAVRELAGKPAAVGLSLTAESAGDAVVLVFSLGDPDLDNRIVYERCDGDCPVTSPAPS